MKSNQTKKQLHQIRTRAKNMYVVSGCTGKEICEKLNITEATFSKWLKKYQWILLKMPKAKELIINQGYTVQQVGKELNLPLNILNGWIEASWNIGDPIIIKSSGLNKNKSATRLQIKEIKELFNALNLVEEEVCGVKFNQINDVNFDLAEYLLYILKENQLEALELTIKTSN